MHHMIPNSSLFGGYLLPMPVTGPPMPMASTSSPTMSAPSQHQLPGYGSRATVQHLSHLPPPPPILDPQSMRRQFVPNGPTFYPMPPSVYPPNLHVPDSNRDMRAMGLSQGPMSSLSSRPSNYSTLNQTLDVPPTIGPSSSLGTLPPPHHPHHQHHPQPPVCAQGYQSVVSHHPNPTGLNPGMMHIDPLRLPHFHQRPMGVSRRPVANGPPGQMGNLSHHLPSRRIRHLAAPSNFTFGPPPPLPPSASSSNSMAAAAAAAATVALAEYHSTLRSFGLPAVRNFFKQFFKIPSKIAL